jgi:hypothetical protein
MWVSSFPRKIPVLLTEFVIMVSEHVGLMPSEDDQLTETCKEKGIPVQAVDALTVARG